MSLQQRSSLFVAVWSLLLLFTGLNAKAQITTTLNSNAMQLAQQIAGAGVTVSNATLVCNTRASGSFTAGAAAIGITDGVSLGTGNITLPNANSGSLTCVGTDFGGAGYAPLLPVAVAGKGTGVTDINDACRLEFDVVPTTANIQFKYCFGSDEYDEYVGDDFNDAFAFFISGPGITGTQNIGVIPNTTTPITINTVNSTATGNPAYYRSNRGTQTGFDGTTVVMTAKANVQPCKTYHLVLAIGDGNDGCWDSNVWIEQKSLISTGVTQVPPTTSGTLGNSRIYENCDSATFKFSLQSALTSDYGFKISIKGTATNGTDYRLISDTLSIKAGKLDTTITIVPKNDSTLIDPGETVTICILEACTNIELACQTVTIEELSSTITPPATICVKDSAQILTTFNVNYKYKWTPNTGMNCDTCYNPKVSPTDTTDYTVVISDKTCSITKKTKINIIRSYAGLDDSLTVCENGATVDLFTKTVDAPPGGHWIDPSGAAFTNPYNPPVHSPGTYLYAVSQNNCPEDTSKMEVKEIALPVAGTDGLDTTCNTNANFDLFSVITNEPAGGTWSGPGSVGATTGTLSVTSLSPGTYKYLYIVKGTAPCPNDTAIATVVVKALPTAAFPAVAPFCNGTTGYLKPTFTGVAPFSLTYTDCDGTSYTVNNLKNGDSIAITPSTSPCTYTITSVTDGGNFPCTNTKTSTRSVSLLSPPTMQVDSLVCNSINTGYRVYITMSGGDQPSYAINGSSTGITANKFISAQIPGGNTYTFTLTDKNGCLPTPTVSGSKKCDCVTDAGTMQSAVIQVCGADTAKGTHNNNHKLDANDARMFILHDDAGVSLGTVYAINKTAPNFSYNPAWGINYDQTYYISSVAGDRTAADPAVVDTTDPAGCMSISTGQPVIFHQIPAASATIAPTQICIGDSSKITFSYSAGKEPYSFDVSYLGNTKTYNNKTIANPSDTVRPSQLNNNTYTATKVTDKFGCTATMNVPLVVNVVDRPDTNGRFTTCNSTNTAYTVSFNITNGDVATYTVDGTPLNGATSFTSAPITSGQAYSFAVNDGNNCKIITVAGSNTCPCVSKAGTMTIGPAATPLEFCINSSATAAHNGNQTLDGNDTLSYILCINPNNPIGTLIQHKTTPTFAFIPGMIPNQTYYICPIAGDKNAANMVDVTSACRNTTPGTPVKFIPLPDAKITGNTEICAGTSANIQVTVTGNKTIAFVLRGNDGTTKNVSGTGTFNVPVTPQITSGTVRYTIDTAGTPGVFDSTSPTSCEGAWTSAPVDIIVHPIPTATISGTEIICSGDTAPLTIVTTGDGLLTVVYGYSGWTDTFTAAANTHIRKIKHANAGNYNYGIISITDNTPGTCTNTGNGAANVTVRPIPQATMTITDPDVCRNETSKLFFQNTGYGPFSIYFHDQKGTKYSKYQVGDTGSHFLDAMVLDSSKTFTLDSIADATQTTTISKSCSRAYAAPVSIIVRQLPYGRISGNNEICSGTSSMIYFDFNPSPADSLTAVYRFVNKVTGATGASSIQTYDSRLDSLTITPTDTATYTLVSVTDQFGCMALTPSGSAFVPVNPIPVPRIAATDSASCPPLETTILNYTRQDHLGTYVWHFGDGTTFTGNGMDPGTPKTYSEAGTYTVRLEVTTPQGCYADTTIENFLVVHPFPTAEFNWNPKPVLITEPTAQFSNLSVDEHVSLWNMYDIYGTLLNTSTERHPQYTFPDKDTGTYIIDLRVETEFGCPDSIRHFLSVEGVFEIYAPNTFTPNGDGVNDSFLPAMFGEKPETYELSVFNRWGEVIFFSQNYQEAWNGTYKGDIVKEDVYVFLLKVRSKYNAEKREVVGQVRVLR